MVKTSQLILKEKSQTSKKNQKQIENQIDAAQKYLSSSSSESSLILASASS